MKYWSFDLWEKKTARIFCLDFSQIKYFWCLRIENRDFSIQTFIFWILVASSSAYFVPLLASWNLGKPSINAVVTRKDRSNWWLIPWLVSKSFELYQFCQNISFRLLQCSLNFPQQLILPDVHLKLFFSHSENFNEFFGIDKNTIDVY